MFNVKPLIYYKICTLLINKFNIDKIKYYIILCEKNFILRIDLFITMCIIQ